MPQAIIYLDEKLNKKLESISKELNISKHEVILKLLNEGELKNGS